MHEEILKNYFEGKLNINHLYDDLIGTSVKHGEFEVRQEIVKVTKGEFILEKKHFIRLLEDVVIFNLDPSFLEPLSFAILGSDYFKFDYDITSNEIILDFLHEWASPEINYALNLDNVKKCLNKLKKIRTP